MRWLLASVVAAAACGPPPTPPAVRLKVESHAGEAILTVVPAPDQRINARVPPAIELAAGGVIRLARGRVSADSSYFVEPPWGVRPPGLPVRGALRVSVCGADELLCRMVTLSVDLEE